MAELSYARVTSKGRKKKAGQAFVNMGTDKGNCL